MSSTTFVWTGRGGGGVEGPWLPERGIFCRLGVFSFKPNSSPQNFVFGIIVRVGLFKKIRINKMKTPGLNDSQTGTSPRGLGDAARGETFPAML